MNNNSGGVGLAIVLLGSLTGGLEACSAAGEEGVAETQQAVYDYDENAGVFVPGTAGDTMRNNVVVSLWRRGKWSTPGARNDGDGCSGVLITPKLVLTASSCTRKLGTSELDVYVGGRTPDVAGPGEATKFESESLSRWGAEASEPSLRGFDLLVVRLKTPVLEQARIHRPPLASPTPLTALDSEGWAPYAAGIAGWSPFTMIPGLTVTGAQTTRQVFFKTTAGDDELRLNRVATSGGGGLWVATTLKPVTKLPKLGLAPGDNGGPLFVMGHNSRRDVIGIASVIGTPPDPAMSPTYDFTLVPSHLQATCTTPEGAPVPANEAPYQCNTWTDITTVNANAFIRSVATDSRSTRWNAMHPRVGEGQSGSPWIGEVDYTGACTTATDPDCDHTYTSNADGSLRDNCPAMSNVDQVDTADAGMGDVCTTACANQTCSAANSCSATKITWPACSALHRYQPKTLVTSPSGAYGSSACYARYSATLDKTEVPPSGSVWPGIDWADAALTTATCPNARLELTVFRKAPTGQVSATTHRYQGGWVNAIGFSGCSFQRLVPGFAHPDPIFGAASESIRLAGSAWIQSGGVAAYKKVSLTFRLSGDPCSGSSAAVESCTTCVKSSTVDLTGLCCTCNGQEKRFVRSTTRPNMYLCTGTD